MSNDRSSRQPAIAVVGVSALFPGSQDATGFWNDILAGRDLIGDVPASHWRIDDYYDPDPSAPDKTYARRGGFLSPIDFDALGFGIPPATLPATDTSQLLALIVAQAVLEDAARDQLASIDRSRISVILGVTSAQELLFSMVSRLQRPVWVKALRETGLPEDEVQAACDRIAAQYVPWQEASFPGLLGNVVAGRIANRLNLGGTNCVTDAACASTFSALSMAVNELVLGHSDMAIAGGVDTLNDIFMYMCFSKTPALSPSGDCRPFSDQADGTMLGEGLGMVALKRLDDAERDGDRIYAVLRGIGTGSDGRAKSVYAPVAAGQARTLARAYAAAGYGPETVELLEAHGTGTKAGDIAEFEGLSQVFDAGGQRARQWCALGSVKSQIGHTKAAAGAAGLFKAVMALHHKVLPPTIKVAAPNPKLAIADSPFYLNTETRPWIRAGDHPRRAAVSAFGFGGSNFHVTLEEYTGSGARAERLATQSCDLVLFAAATVPELLQQIDAAVARDAPLACIAHDSRVAFDAVSAPTHRAVVVAATREALRQRLAAVRARIATQPDQGFDLPDGSSYGVGAQAGKVAFLFPGQGSQYLGMGAAIAMQFDAARRVFDATADLAMEGDTRLHEVMFPRPAFDDATRRTQQDTLTCTEWAQPALGAHAAALLAQLRELGIGADAQAGHSFGEVVALHAGGAFDARTAVQIARRRGELMRDAAATTRGAMTALSLDIDRVKALLAAHAPELVVANHNAPNQVVVSGALAAIAAFEAALQRDGIGFKRLPVATAFHSPLVAPCSAAFAQALATQPIVPLSTLVYGNAGGACFPADVAGMSTQLAAQIAQPVRFVDVIETMHGDGVRTFVEVGPGSVLCGLVDAVLGERPHRAIALDRKGRDGVESLLIGLARLAAAGVSMQAARLFADTRRPQAVASVAKLAVSISGSNHGKPYPPANPHDIPAPNPPRAVVTTTSTFAATDTLAGTEDMRVPNSPSEAWLAAFQESQQQAAAAHATFQRTMAESHAAYLKLAESALLGLSGIAPPVAESTGVPAVAHVLPEPQALRPALLPQASMPQPQPETSIPAPLPSPLRPQGLDLPALLMSIVAEKTGYPIDMLNLDMDLEGDLGIDSIKRVEILAAVDERAPTLPKVDRARLSALHTLREIVDYLGAQASDSGAAPVTAAIAMPAPQPGVDLPALLMSIVAEKTGYPIDMLNLDMDLEGDLGIDSIKRVEILAAVDERAPSLPKVDRARLSALHTLREIVDYLGGNLAAVAAVTAAEVATPSPEPQAARLPLPAPTLGRYALELIPAPATGFALPGLLSGLRVHITGDDSIAPLLAEALRVRGVQALAVSAPPESSTACIFLGGLRKVRDADDAMTVNRDAFRMARALAPRLQQGGGLFVTVQDSGGTFGVDAGPDGREWLSGMPALIKTAALEWPQASVKAIDVQQQGRTPQHVAQVIADELIAGGGEVEIALPADGRRLTLRSVARQADAVAPVIDDGDVVVVSGGARGVTAACLQAWAGRVQARFVLLGRTVLQDEPAACRGIADEAGLKRALFSAALAAGEQLAPAALLSRVHAVLAQREIRQTLAALQAAGSAARYCAVAVEDQVALAAALAEVRADWGPIRGVVHAAGVLADKRIAEKTDAQFRHVFDTKVRGLQALLAATASDPLKLLCVFSSVSARCGNTGQADYAMANEVLAKVAAAEARRRPGLRVKSLGWGPWEGGMVSPHLQARFAELGVPMIPLAQGARMFADEMADAGRDGVELVLGGEPRAEALLFDGAEQRVDALEFSVQRASHGWLEGHAVDGAPVVPVVLVAEWLTRAARSFRPGLALTALHDLKVLKGIRLDRFENGGDRFRIDAQPLRSDDATLLQMTLRDEAGRPRYSARAELRLLPVQVGDDTPDLVLDAWTGVAPYPSALFHRGQFELIEQMQGISDQGVAARVRGVHAAAWPTQDWQLDVAALDGGMQLAVLYGQRMLGRANLPTAIDRVRHFAMPPAAGAITATAHRRAVGPAAVVTDIYFVDAQGRRVADLIGVHNHALASA